MEDVEMTDLTSGRGFHGSEVPRGNGGQSRMPTNVVPLVVAQIINSKAAEFRMFRMPVNIAKLVGIVRKFTVETVKASCFIQDHTGTIKAITWLENESKFIKLANPKGVIKSENGKVILTPKELDQEIAFQTAVIFCFSFVPSVICIRRKLSGSWKLEQKLSTKGHAKKIEHLLLASVYFYSVYLAAWRGHSWDSRDYETICQSAFIWNKGEEQDMSNIPLNLEGKYVECFGRIRQEPTGKVIMALKMVEIKDCNIINTHLLEVLYIRLEAEAAMKKQRSLATSKGDALAKVLVESEHDQPSSPSAHPNSSSMVTTMVEKLPSLQRKIYTLLTCDSTVTGLSAKAIMAGFQEHSRDQILSALKGLCEEGFIYSTIDEQHFKAIEF